VPIELNCPECGASLTIPDGSAGRQTRCPRCSAVFAAPPATDDPGTNHTEPNSIGANSTGAPLTPPDGPATVDTSNPYAPTFSSAPIQPQRSSDWAPRQIAYDEVFSKAWAIFKEQWLMACAAILIVGGVNFGLGVIQSILTQLVAAAGDEPAIVFGSQFVIGAGRWLLQIWLQIGQTIVLLDIARGREVKLGKIFGGGPLLLKTILAVIMVSLAIGAIAMVLVGIPAAVGLAITQEPGGAMIGAVVGLLIAIFPIFVVSLMFSQVQILIVDRGLESVDSLRTSYDITNGNKLTLFVIGLLMGAVFLVAVIAGLLALCVGIIPAMIGAGAFGSLLLVVAYLCMTGQQVATERTFISPAPT
jgi:predicted Zn finger-like uncharacterized protein